MRGERDADRTIHCGELFDREYVVDVSQAGPAIFRRNDHTQQTHCSEFLHHIDWELAGFVPLHHVWCNLPRGKIANLPPEMLLIFGQYKGIKAIYRFNLNGHDFAPMIPFLSEAQLTTSPKPVRCGSRSHALPLRQKTTNHTFL